MHWHSNGMGSTSGVTELSIYSPFIALPPRLYTHLSISPSPSVSPSSALSTFLRLPLADFLTRLPVVVEEGEVIGDHRDSESLEQDATHGARGPDHVAQRRPRCKVAVAHRRHRNDAPPEPCGQSMPLVTLQLRSNTPTKVRLCRT